MTDIKIFKLLIVFLYSKLFPKGNSEEYTFTEVFIKLTVIWLPMLLLLAWVTLKIL